MNLSAAELFGSSFKRSICPYNNAGASQVQFVALIWGCVATHIPKPSESSVPLPKHEQPRGAFELPLGFEIPAQASRKFLIPGSVRDHQMAPATQDGFDQRRRR